MQSSRAIWVRAGLLAAAFGAAACGSVSPLAPDAGGTAGSAATGTGGHQGTAGTHGAAGTQGSAGTQGGAGSTQDAAVDGAGGSTAVDAAVGMDAGVDHPPDACPAGGCPGGTCWEQLDGAKACVTPPPTPTLASCQTSTGTCCLHDADCAQTSATNARCLPLIDVKENYCGGAIPVGNVCRSDQCRADADCKAAAVAGATVWTCLPAGAFGLYNAACVSGICRTDADCTVHAGGRCQYGQAATKGVCSLHNVLFCAYPTDACGNSDSPPCGQGMTCVPNDNFQGRQCGQSPPQYP